MELLPGVPLNISLSFIFGLMVKILMIMLLLMSLIMVRQENLMNRVVNIPLGGSIKILVLAFFFLTLILTALVVVA